MRFVLAILCASLCAGCAVKDSGSKQCLQRGGIKVEGVGDYYQKKRQHFFMRIFSRDP